MVWHHLQLGLHSAARFVADIVQEGPCYTDAHLDTLVASSSANNIQTVHTMMHYLSVYGYGLSYISYILTLVSDLRMYILYAQKGDYDILLAVASFGHLSFAVIGPSASSKAVETKS